MTAFDDDGLTGGFVGTEPVGAGPAGPGRGDGRVSAADNASASDTTGANGNTPAPATTSAPAPAPAPATTLAPAAAPVPTPAAASTLVPAAVTPALAGQTASAVASGSDRVIDVVSLYPADMNIYGDWGNVLTVSRRLECYGYRPVLHAYNQGDPWPERVDLVLGGGGQDSGQKKIQDDFMRRADDLRALAAAGTPMLVVCGLYQLFGNYFETLDGYRIPGIGIFDAATIGRRQRLIGNIVEESAEFGTIVGYENHSGQTFLGEDTQALATVSQGEGNNCDDATEGARVGAVIGTYLHGSLLPKNPRIADFLIQQAAERRYGAFEPVISQQSQEQLTRLDRLAQAARKVAQGRPR